MTEFKARKPDFKGDGIAIWKEKTVKGDTFLKVKVLGGKAIN